MPILWHIKIYSSKYMHVNIYIYIFKMQYSIYMYIYIFKIHYSIYVCVYIDIFKMHSRIYIYISLNPKPYMQVLLL